MGAVHPMGGAQARPCPRPTARFPHVLCHALLFQSSPASPLIRNAHRHRLSRTSFSSFSAVV